MPNTKRTLYWINIRFILGHSFGHFMELQVYRRLQVHSLSCQAQAPADPRPSEGLGAGMRLQANFRVPGPPKVPQIMAQYFKIESTSSIGSIVLGILEVQVDIKEMDQMFQHCSRTRMLQLS